MAKAESGSTIEYPNLDVVRAFAQQHYGDLLRRDKKTRHGDYAARWADRAHQYAWDHFGSTHVYVPPLTKVLIDTIYCAAMLADAQKYRGLLYEDVVQLVNLECGSLVAQVNFDIRMPNPNRMRDHSGQLYQASVQAQIVKLAELTIGLEELLEWFKLLQTDEPPFTEAELNEHATVWLLEAETYGDALHRLRASATMAPIKNWVHRTVKTFADAVKAKKRKADLMAAVTENISQRQARKPKKVPTH